MRPSSRFSFGFSMLELMVVLAIIAFLASIAVPNYFKYLAKAKQAEVALNLTSLHAAMQSHWAEAGSYSATLTGESSIGWQPGGYKKNGQNSFYYTYGFNIPGAQEGVHYFTGKLKTPSAHLRDTFAKQGSFVAAAVGTIAGSDRVDIWSIDENRNLVHVQDGVD